MQNILTIARAAQMYSGTALTESAIRKLVVTGSIPSRKIGVKYLILESDLEAWVNGSDDGSTKTEQKVVPR